MKIFEDNSYTLIIKNNKHLTKSLGTETTQTPWIPLGCDLPAAASWGDAVCICSTPRSISLRLKEHSQRHPRGKIHHFTLAICSGEHYSMLYGYNNNSCNKDELI